MADRDYGRGDPRRGEPTPRRNLRDQFEGSGPYGGGYTAGGQTAAGFGGGYAGYDEERDEAPRALRPYPRTDTPRPSMIVGLGGNSDGHGRGGALDYGYGEIQGASYGHSWGGPAEVGGETYRRPDYTGRGPRGYRRSDIRINEDVCDALTEDPRLDASGIEVRVEAGEVTLSGSVDSRPMKRRAEDIADSIRGVTDVHNRLRIAPSASDRERGRGVSVEGGSSVDAMQPGGPAEAYTRAAGTEAGESNGT